MKVDQISQRVTAWTLEQAIRQLRANPDDPYLQYFAIVLAQRENKVDQILQLLPTARVLGRSGNLVSVFAGAAAVQECLQLDAMVPSTLTDMYDSNANRRAALAALSGPIASSVKQLQGPTVSSHPWTEMLMGRRPEVSALSKLVPDDFFLIESRSVKQLLDALAAASSWQKHVLHQVRSQANEFKLVERIQRQLLLDGDQFELLQNSKLSEICFAGSDLYIADGADISMLVAAPQTVVDELLLGVSQRYESTPGTESMESGFFYCGTTKCFFMQNQNRSICVFAANPFAGVHLRSNSREALERILGENGKPIRPGLGTTDEFAFVRLLMPRDEQDEDVFVYFSDPFIRNLVGPKVRIAERRRKICRAYMQMIDSAVLLYCAQEGKRPVSLEALRSAHCLTIDDSRLQCPDSGVYSLLDHQSIARSECSFHGNKDFMKPCLEIGIDTISVPESAEYTNFVQAYNQYWRTYFDPIGISLRMRDGEYRAETVVLPLIDNSIYTGLAMAVGGTPQRLDSVPAHNGSIFGLTAKLSRETVVPVVDSSRPFVDHFLGSDAHRSFTRFLTEGLGEQFGFTVCDAQPTFSLDLPLLMGMAAAAGTNGGARLTGGTLWLPALVASLQMPVYASANVGNAEIVDQFLEKLLPVLLLNLPAQFGNACDYARIDSGSGRSTTGLTFTFGPVKFRLFLERIENSLYISTQLPILDGLCNQVTARQTDRSGHETERATKQEAPCAHAMLTLTPANWKMMRHEASLSWHENNRRACHNNLGYLSIFARALSALDGAGRSEQYCGDLHEAIRASAERRACPDHGVYTFDGSEQVVTCSQHGNLFKPRQQNHDAQSQDALIPLLRIESVVGALTFIEEGLKAELVVRTQR